MWADGRRGEKCDLRLFRSWRAHEPYTVPSSRPLSLQSHQQDSVAELCIWVGGELVSVRVGAASGWGGGWARVSGLSCDALSGLGSVCSRPRWLTGPPTPV